MKRLTLFLLGLLAGVALAAEPLAENSKPAATWSGHASYVIGHKQLESDWSPVEGQLEFGILDLDLCPPDWPVSLCTQLLLTHADAPPDVPGAEGDYSGAWEINLGVRKVFDVARPVNLFVGGGVAFLGASSSSWFDFGVESGQFYVDSDFTVGAWASGGLYWNVSAHWHLGVELQYSWGEIELFAHALNAGGFHALGMFGYHW